MKKEIIRIMTDLDEFSNSTSIDLKLSTMLWNELSTNVENDMKQRFPNPTKFNEKTWTNEFS